MNPAYEIRGSAAWISLDDGKVNAMRTQELSELGRLIDRAKAESAQSIVIRGRAGVFSAGLDLRWLPSLASDDLHRLMEAFSETLLKVYRCQIPTVALVSGHAIAGGCILACACDRRIGLRGPYRFHMNEVAIGIEVPLWASQIVSSAIPAPIRTDVLQLAEPLSFEIADQIGTIHQLAENSDELDRLGESTARELAQLAPSAFADTKRSLRSASMDELRPQQ